MHILTHAPTPTHMHILTHAPTPTHMRILMPLHPHSSTRSFLLTKVVCKRDLGKVRYSSVAAPPLPQRTDAAHHGHGHQREHQHLHHRGSMLGGTLRGVGHCVGRGMAWSGAWRGAGHGVGRGMAWGGAWRGAGHGVGRGIAWGGARWHPCLCNTLAISKTSLCQVNSKPCRVISDVDSISKWFQT
jgi:hypothetical protein